MARLAEIVTREREAFAADVWFQYPFIGSASVSVDITKPISLLARWPGVSTCDTEMSCSYEHAPVRISIF